MKNQLTIQQLAMYIGCEVIVGNDELRSHIIAVKTNGCIQTAHAIKSQDHFDFEYVKPILRRLDTMDEQEKKEFEGTQSLYQLTSASSEIVMARITFWTVKSFEWALSHGFDIFNLIPDGLAIDRDTLK